MSEMEKNNKIGLECVKIIEDALKQIKRAVVEDTEQQKTIESISNRLDSIEESIKKIEVAIA